ncbi:tetratricopeptide repeat protein [Brevibacillus sp. HB1.2]|uniref:tetratricopeptide repeat protein n=1 Tax=unclassified Brevibacillus TaxID=2684853 RepID=UPI00156AB473|nr:MULTISPECIES: tetratricopeptide repeat protein [unclassified Brevibacillus]NRS17046.1 tetratricopeptide repeat protein [Brevibacillus sp. HB1.4B]NTU21286.1 tetratricopeptide repeat protein [Brevibacillus sp. HB1.2]NTU30620.1 tetratricopeptide repeat protein [Brevibacillus sp. HB1.1]
MNPMIQNIIQLRKEGHLDEAIQLALQLVSQSPTDPVAHYQCAWCHDAAGLEKEAVPFYEKAIELGLSVDDDLQGALLGLGSTYRVLGLYEQAAATLAKGMQQFPEDRSFPIFLSMAYYNLGKHHEAMNLLLKNLAETSSDPTILAYHKAILFYADDLNMTW